MLGMNQDVVPTAGIHTSETKTSDASQVHLATARVNAWSSMKDRRSFVQLFLGCSEKEGHVWKEAGATPSQFYPRRVPRYSSSTTSNKYYHRKPRQATATLPSKASTRTNKYKYKYLYLVAKMSPRGYREVLSVLFSA